MCEREKRREMKLVKTRQSVKGIEDVLKGVYN